MADESQTVDVLSDPQSPIPAFTRHVFGANARPDRPYTCKFLDRLSFIYQARTGHWLSPL
jgi:hypothetical protein